MSRDARAKLRARLQEALRKEKTEEALSLYAELEKAEPTEPRWPHRRGDLLRRIGREWQAIDCYQRAVRAYSELGFVARAAAMAKVILAIDPGRTSILEEVDGAKAQELHRAKRPGPPPLPPKSEKKRRSRITDDALVLELAEDADDDEIRFVDIDIDVEDPIEIRVSPQELAPRPPTRRTLEDIDLDDIVFLDLDEEPERIDVDTLAELPSMPLFAELPPEALSRLLQAAELVELKEGDALMRTGDDSNALFVLVEGQVEVKVPGRHIGDAILLGEGDLVGESCLLDDVHRRADVIARGPVGALRIPKATLDDLVDEYAELGDVILELLGRRLISNMLQTSPVFAAFDATTRSELAALFELRRANEGLILVKPGKRSDGLYCTLLGELELFVGNETRRAGPGIIFGQRTLLSHEPSRLGVRCATEVLLLRLSAQKFTTLAAMYPTVLMYLSELASGDHGDPTS
ncbi:MAG: cyclic nucleotide-binding domain-containing protein [Myxococcota bacterium]